MKLPCSIQLIDPNIDFHPSDAVALPIELAPPLADQRFAIQAMIQFGLACVPASAVKTSRLYAFTHDISRAQRSQHIARRSGRTVVRTATGD